MERSDETSGHDAQGGPSLLKTVVATGPTLNVPVAYETLRNQPLTSSLLQSRNCCAYQVTQRWPSASEPPHDAMAGAGTASLWPGNGQTRRSGAYRALVRAKTMRFPGDTQARGVRSGQKYSVMHRPEKQGIRCADVES